MPQLGFAFNADECAGCKACMIACKDIHDMPIGFKLRKVYTAEAGSWDTELSACRPRGVFSYSISIACNHCDLPACFEACAQGAISKNPETGIVTVDENKCIGCGSCTEACPYGAPVVLPDDGKSHKCDLCMDRIAEGQEPACVAACMTRCLTYGSIEDLRTKFGSVADNALLPDSSETSPNIVIAPHRFDEGLRTEDILLYSASEEIENG